MDPIRELPYGPAACHGRIIEAGNTSAPDHALHSPSRFFLHCWGRPNTSVTIWRAGHWWPCPAIADSKGDIQSGLDVIEFACGVPHLLKGEYTEGAGPGIDVYSMRQAMGVCAGITPFSFPGMIPMWMFGVAIACGNTFILKLPEKDSSLPVRLAELMLEAGAPEGVLNVVHGDKEVVDAILTHPDIRAVSFVGSSDIAQYVYSTVTAHGKRVRAMGGAKNHGVILPDVDFDQVTKDRVGSEFGSAGERCMALPVAVAVGKGTAEELIERLTPEMGYEKGFFIGPTLFDHVKPTMKSYQ